MFQRIRQSGSDLFRDEARQFLLEMGRHVRSNQGVLTLILHLQDMADAMKFRDEI